MPIFQVTSTGLRPYRRLAPGPDLYESEVEALAWDDLEAFTGEALFPVARQPRIAGGGIPDIVALDRTGAVVIIEVKRDVDRGQLAQCLEYAGWARMTSLDEIAGLYNIRPNHRGPDAFFADWLEFTGSSTPVTISNQPRLYLIARDFQERTRSALVFLRENGLPVDMLPVGIYLDPDGNRVVEIDAEHEPDEPALVEAKRAAPAQFTIDGRRVTVGDLMEIGVLNEGELVVFNRPRLGARYEATINADGTFTLANGDVWNSPSVAAMRVADLTSYDGWFAWQVPRLGGVRLADLRERLINENQAKSDDAAVAPADPTLDI